MDFLLKALFITLHILALNSNIAAPPSNDPVIDKKIDLVAEEYHFWRNNYNHPKYESENVPFADFILIDPAVTKHGLLYNQYIEVGNRLKEKHGYKITPTTLDKAKFDAQVAKRIGRDKESKNLLELLLKQAKNAELKNIAVPDCHIEYTPRIDKSFKLRPEESKGSKQKLSLKQKTNDLNSTVISALEIIGTIDSENKILKQILPQLESKNIALAPITPALIQKYSKVKNGTVAMFLYTEDGAKTVFIELEGEIGLLAVALLHEFTHALDQDYLTGCDDISAIERHMKTRIKSFMATTAKRTGKKEDQLNLDDLTPEENDELSKLQYSVQRYKHVCSFRTEKRAYAAQAILIRELRTKFPCFGPYIDAHEKNKKVITKPITDTQIIDAYGLRPEYTSGIPDEGAFWVSPFQEKKDHLPQQPPK